MSFAQRISNHLKKINSIQSGILIPKETKIKINIEYNTYGVMKDSSGAISILVLLNDERFQIKLHSEYTDESFESFKFLIRAKKLVFLIEPQATNHIFRFL
jgi:DNA-binding transcriptional regulator WhiA